MTGTSASSGGHWKDRFAAWSLWWSGGTVALLAVTVVAAVAVTVVATAVEAVAAALAAAVRVIMREGGASVAWWWPLPSGGGHSRLVVAAGGWWSAGATALSPAVAGDRWRAGVGGRDGAAAGCWRGRVGRQMASTYCWSHNRSCRRRRACDHISHLRDRDHCVHAGGRGTIFRLRVPLTLQAPPGDLTA